MLTPLYKEQHLFSFIFTTPHVSDIYKEPGAHVKQKKLGFIEGKITNMALSGQKEREMSTTIISKF